MPRSLNNQLLKKSKMSHRGAGGGVSKEAKKCHVLLEWPLSVQYILNYGVPPIEMNIV